MFEPIDIVVPPVLPRVRMTNQLYKIYLLMFHEGKRRAKIRQVGSYIYFDNAYGFKVSEEFLIMEDEIFYTGQLGYGTK